MGDEILSVYELTDEEAVKFAKLKGLKENELVKHYGARLEVLLDNVERMAARHRHRLNELREKDIEALESKTSSLEYKNYNYLKVLREMLNVIDISLKCPNCTHNMDLEIGE